MEDQISLSRSSCEELIGVLINSGLSHTEITDFVYNLYKEKMITDLAFELIHRHFTEVRVSESSNAPASMARDNTILGQAGRSSASHMISFH